MPLKKPSIFVSKSSSVFFHMNIFTKFPFPPLLSVSTAHHKDNKIDIQGPRIREGRTLRDCPLRTAQYFSPKWDILIVKCPDRKNFPCIDFYC